MSAFHFKELATQPALGDSIKLRVPGTSTPITGQIKGVSGGNLDNPFLVSAAGVEGDWAFVAPADVPYDVYWVEGDDVIGKLQDEEVSRDTPPDITDLGTLGASVSLDTGGKAEHHAKGTLDVVGTVAVTTFTYAFTAGAQAVVVYLAAGTDPGNQLFTDGTTPGTLTTNSATIAADKSYTIRIWPKHLVAGHWVQIAEMG